MKEKNSQNTKRGAIARAWSAFKFYGCNVVLLSVLTGLASGVIVTFYNICTGYGEQYSRRLYELVLEYPAFIPLLILGLAAAAVVSAALASGLGPVSVAPDETLRILASRLRAASGDARQVLETAGSLLSEILKNHTGQEAVSQEAGLISWNLCFFASSLKTAICPAPVDTSEVAL